MNTKTASRKISHHLRPAVRGFVRCAAVGAVASLAASPAQGAFHLWNIREIYTDSSGSLQFIELFCPAGGQTVLNNMQISVTPTGGGAAHTFTIPGNLSIDTANRALLFATTAADVAGAPTPDYVLPASFLFPGGGTISFFGANSGAYTALPTDGVLSRTWTGGNAANTPQNFAGQVGMVVPVPEPSSLALFGTGAFGLWLMLRRRRA